MLKRWRKQQVEGVIFEDLLQKCRTILSGSKVIVFVPDNTGANWLGVKTASLGMFPKNCVVLPQNHSNSLLSVAQQNVLFTTLLKAGTKLVVFSGIPNYVLSWMHEFNSKGTQNGVIYHGGLAELTGNTARQEQMAMLLKMANNGIINRIGVVKEGLNDWFKLKTTAAVYRTLPALNIPSDLKIKKFNDGKLHIGIFGNSSYNKNRHTQVAAASMIENSVVHILAPNEFAYALPEERLIVHENLSRTAFLELLGSMDVNLYCSYSESWGQVVLESFSLNVPCVFTDNSGLHKIVGSEYCVSSYDNLFAIAEKIKLAVNNNPFKIQQEVTIDLINNNEILEF